MLVLIVRLRLQNIYDQPWLLYSLNSVFGVLKVLESNLMNSCFCEPFYDIVGNSQISDGLF